MWRLHSVTFLQKLLTFLVYFRRQFTWLDNDVKLCLQGCGSNLLSSFTLQPSSLQYDRAMCGPGISQRSGKVYINNFPPSSPSGSLFSRIPSSLFNNHGCHELWALVLYARKAIGLLSKAQMLYSVPTLLALRLEFILIGNLSYASPFLQVSITLQILPAFVYSQILKVVGFYILSRIYYLQQNRSIRSLLHQTRTQLIFDHWILFL